MYFRLKPNMKSLYLVLLVVFAIFVFFSQDITFVNNELHLKKDAPYSETTIVNGIIYLSG